MDREMRRKDRMLTAEDADKILRENKYGVLCTVCQNGYPYGLPMSYAYEDGTLYFHHTNERSLLSENVNGQTPACFTVVGDTELLPAAFATKYESVIAFGTLREVSDKLAVTQKLVQALSPDFTEQGVAYAAARLDKLTVYELKIQQVTAKARR